MGGRLGSDVVQMVYVLRQIAIKTCVVFAAGLLTSVAAFIVMCRLEPDEPVVISKQDSPGRRPAHRRDEAVPSIVTSGTDSSGYGVTGTATAECNYGNEIKMAHRMPFSETHV